MPDRKLLRAVTAFICIFSFAQTSQAYSPNSGTRLRDPAFQQFILSLTVADALNLYQSTLTQLSTLHADPEKVTPEKLYQLGFSTLQRALRDPEFTSQHFEGMSSANARALEKWIASLDHSPTTVSEARQRVRTLLLHAVREFGLKSPSAIVLEFVCGAAEGIDHFTTYLNPTAASEVLIGPIVELAKYGILVRFEAGRVVIDEVVAGSWATTHTMLSAGDEILRVNGRPSDPRKPSWLKEAMQTSAMGLHVIEANHSDMTADGTNVAQLPIPAPTVFGAEILRTHSGIGYLRIASFCDATPGEFDRAYQELRAQGLRVLIVDLRGNPGGLLRSAIDIAERFIPAGVIVTTAGQALEFANRAFTSTSGFSASTIPLVVLTDHRTMSAAEVLAAAWKDHHRATLVGWSTFGKGSVQSPIQLLVTDRNSQTQPSYLIITVARLFRPAGPTIDRLGVDPHFVECDPNRQLNLAIQKATQILQERMP